MFSFGVAQKFRAFSRPLNTILEGNAFNNFSLKCPQLPKTVRNLKIGQGLVFWATLMRLIWEKSNILQGSALQNFSTILFSCRLHILHCCWEQNGNLLYLFEFNIFLFLLILLCQKSQYIWQLFVHSKIKCCILLLYLK